MQLPSGSLERINHLSTGRLSSRLSSYSTSAFSPVSSIARIVLYPHDAASPSRQRTVGTDREAKVSKIAVTSIWRHFSAEINQKMCMQPTKCVIVCPKDPSSAGLFRADSVLNLPILLIAFKIGFTTFVVFRAG